MWLPDLISCPGTGHIIRVPETHQRATLKTQLSDPVSWERTQCSKIAVNSAVGQPAPQFLFQGDALIAKNRDKLKLGGDTIFVNASSSSGLSIGRIIEILIDSTHQWTATHIALQVFHFSATLHPTLHLPCLQPSDEKVVVHSEVR